MIILEPIALWGSFRCHGLRLYPVCVCNTVRLGQDTTWNRRVHGLRVYPVCVCNTVRLGQDTIWNRREHRLSVSPNWVCTMLGGYLNDELSRMDSVTLKDKPSHSIRCVYRADLILCRKLTDHLRKHVLQYYLIKVRIMYIKVPWTTMELARKFTSFSCQLQVWSASVSHLG